MARLAKPSEPFSFFQFLVAFTLLSVSSAGPSGQRTIPKCVSFCGEGRNFHYEPGTTYVYDFTSDLETLVGQESQQRSHVRVTAKAEIEAVSSCDLKLQLKNVNLEDLTTTATSNQDLFHEHKSQLEQYSLVFGFQDGKIEEICANQNEDVWVLNVKRGIISMLQNSMEDLTTSGFSLETDINGRCPTEYILDGSVWGGGVSYKKIKDLSKCTDRQTGISGVHSVSYSSNSPIQNIPLLQGKLECKQTVRNKRIEKIHCKEKQTFQPFEDRSSASNTVVQTLDYVSEHAAQKHSSSEVNAAYTKKNLLFESFDEANGKEEGEDNASEILSLINTLEAASFPTVTPNAPKLFASFVEKLRESNEESIKHVYEMIKDSNKEKYLMEALPLISTSSSLSFLRDLTLNSDLSEEQIQSWLTSLAFIKHPSLNMIKAVSPIIRKMPTMELLLGISSMINSYCKNNPFCNQEVAVNEILEKITSDLGSSCHVDETDADEVRQMVLRLKALGNAGMLPFTEEVSKMPVVMKCILDKSNIPEVRLAAIDSLRRLPCQTLSNNDQLTNLFTNVEEKTEIRIKAFLTIMKCANRQTVELVKSVLYTESVNQVASFVWTFMTNLQETNRPEKQVIRDLVGNEFLKNKFSTDARKFSRNYEASTYWEDWNVGGGLDSNIIFTEESFLPKSGMLNLTVQLFGQSVNLLEFGVRTHGLEQVLEKVFGPQGYFPDNRVTEFLESSRVKRDASSQQDNDGLGYLYDQAKPSVEQAPGGSFYTRVFGQEILYKNFHVSDKTTIPSIIDDSGKSWFSIKNILNNLSTGKSSEFSKSMILLDSSYMVATSSGFPLSLGVQAASTMSLVSNGKFSIGKFMESRELDIHGTVKPSTIINVDGTLGMQIGRGANQLKTGLKLHNTLRSSTAVEINLLMKGKDLLHASVDFPQNKHEIIDMSSELFFMGPKGDIPIINGQPLPSEEINEIADYVTNGCSANYLSDIFGLRLCLEMDIPSKFSFTPKRPAYFRIYMEKTEDFNGYTVDYKFSSDSSTTKLSAVLDTPESTINRRMAADFLLDKGMGKLAASLESVATALRTEAVYTQFHKNFELSLVTNEKTSFLVSTGVRSDGNVIKPHFLITYHNRPLMDLKGSIDVTPQVNNEGRTSIEMNLKHLTETPVKIFGEVTGSAEAKEASLSIESYILTGNVRSQLKRKPGHWSTKTTVDYSWKRGKVYTGDISAKLQKSRKGALSKYLITAGLSTTQFPDNTFDFHWETQASGGFCENSLRMGWGKTQWEGHTLFSRQYQFDHTELRLECSLTSVKYEVDYRLEFAHGANPDGFKTKALGRLGTGNEMSANFEYVSLVDDLLKKSVEGEVSWPNSEYSIKALFFEKQRGNFEAEITVNLNKTRDLKATAQYLNRSNNLRLDHEIAFRARGFTSVPFSGTVGLSATEKQTHIGCQIQFEGKKPYSSRMSTSLDYSHTKFTHKLEGKVTLNERKYNGEIFYGTGKAGAKNLTVDLYLENHVFLQATLSGMLPNPMIASLLVIPDKDAQPDNKVQLDGNLDPRSLSLGVHYFGEELGIAGRYDDESLLVEAVWPEENKIVMSVVLPKFSLAEAQIEIDILTPFEGYKNITLIAQHQLDEETLNTTMTGGVEDSLGEINLSGIFSSREVSIATDITVTGLPKYQGSILVLRKSKRKSLQISLKSDDKESLLDFDFIHLEEGYLGKFIFFGCPFFSKVSMEINHQFSASHVSTYSTKFEWAENSTLHMKEIFFLVKLQRGPLSVQGTFTSPWSPHVVGSLIWDSEKENKQLSLTAKENSDSVTSLANFKLTFVGNMKEFRHELDGEWYGKTGRITISGGLDGFSDSNFHGVLRLPHNQFSLDFLSKKEPQKYIGELRGDVDGSVTTAGLKWDFSSEITQHKIISIWGQRPRYPAVSGSLEYINVGNVRNIKMKVDKKDDSILDMETDLHFSGSRQWVIDFALKSEIELIPSISLKSNHDLSDLEKIKHLTKIMIIPQNEERFWLNSWNISTRQLSVDVAVDNLEDIKGSLILGHTDFVFTGKVEKITGGYKSNLKISSNQFHEVNFQGSFSNDNKNAFSTVGEFTKKNGDVLLKYLLTLKQEEKRKSGSFSLESSLIPTINGIVDLNTNDKLNATLSLTLGNENLMSFNVHGMITPSTGNGHAKLSSTYFTSISNLKLDLYYDWSKRGVNGKIGLQDSSNIYSAKLESSWGEDEKTVKFLYETSSVEFLAQGSVTGLSQLKALAEYNGNSLGEISISYRPEEGDYSFGKHGIYMTYVDGEATTQNYNIIVGVDSKKIFLNLQTPIEDWTNIVVDGQVTTPSGIGKGVKFLLERETESIRGSFEAKNSRKTGTLQLQSDLSVVGFSKLRQMILDTAQVTNPRGLSAFHQQNFVFQLTWATNNFNLKVETPVDFMKEVSLTGNWELKKPRKSFTINGQVNGKQYNFKTDFQNENGNLKLKADELLHLECDYDFSNGYKANISVIGPNEKWNVGGKILVTQDSLKVDVETPLRRYHQVSVTLAREIVTLSKGVYSVAWNINGNGDIVKLNYEIEQGRIELRGTSPFAPWNSVVVTAIYDTPFRRLAFHSQRGDGQEIKVNFGIESSGNVTTFQNPASSSILVAIESPLEHFEDIKFSLLYDRKDLVHVANLSIIRNDGETEGKLNFKFQHSNPVALDISAYLASPALTSKATAHASLLVDPSGESTISAHVQANGKRYEMYGSSQLTSTDTKFEMRTSLNFLRQLKLSLKRGHSISLYGLWTGNGNQVEVHGDVLCTGLRLSKVSFNVSTPVDMIGSFGFDGEVRSETGGNTNAKIVFQNHEVRWSAKLSRILEEGGKEDWRLQINTPLVGYKHVVISLKHHNHHSSERTIIGSVQLNKKEMSMKMIYKPKQLNVVLASELSNLPIQAKIDSDWRNDILLKIDTNAGNNEYGTLFNLELQGISNGFLDFSVSSLSNLNTHLDWDFHGDRTNGQGLVNVKNSFLGSRSLRSSWRNDKNWQDLQCDVWVRTGNRDGGKEKGVTIQYKVVPHASYGSIQASANYTLSEGSKTISFDGSLDKTATHLAFDSVLRTPFNDFQTFDIKGNLTMKKNIEFKIETNMNEEKLISGDLALSLAPLKSELLVELDLPLITDPLELAAVYDIAAENKLIRLLFRQNVYVIDVQLGVVIPKNSHMIDINLKAESTVPNLLLDVNGDVKMEYAVSEDGARQLSFSMKGNEVGEWKLMAMIRATHDLYSKVIFEGPFWLMPTLMAEFSFGGNMRQGLQSDLTLILEGSEVTGNLQYEKNKFAGNFKYAVGGYLISGDAEVILNSADLSNLNIRYKKGNEYDLHVTGELKMTPETRQGTGSVTITSGAETVIPLSFDISMENHGNIRAIGSSHEKQVKVEANLQGTNGGSWLLEGNTFVKIEGNILGSKDDVDVTLQAQHYLRDGKYSINATTGEDGFTLETYLVTGHHANLFAKLKWMQANLDMLIDVKLRPSTLNVIVNIPNILDVGLSGEYGSTEDISFINGILELNNQKSYLNTSLLKDGARSVCKAILEVPSIKQKLDVEITSLVTVQQSMEGTIDLSVNDQRFQISGSLDSQSFESSRGERYIERKLQLTSNVTALSLTTIGLELFLRKPISSFSSVSITGALTINDHATTLLAGYEIPSVDSSETGLYLKLDSAYLPSDESYEFFLKSFGNRMRKVEGKLNYKLTRVDVLWDLIMPTSVISLSYLGRSDDGEKVSLQIESVLNPKEDIQLNINSQGWDTHYIFRASLTRSTQSSIGHLFIDAPRLFTSACEYKITITNNEDGSYTMAASAARGRLIMELVGEAEVTGRSINTVVKAMGSYGSHYVMIVGGQESNGEYGFEITAESSSLLTGKRVNVRGNVTFDEERNLMATLQCRALRHVHELTVSFKKDVTDGKSKFSVNLNSPVIRHSKIESEWIFQQNNYYGELGIEGFDMKHHAEFGLNLNDFEGKLYIVSPLLPSNEFNFHVKSIVNSDNIDILGDIRIRGSHWKFEGVAAFVSIQDMTFKLETRTPFEFLDRVTFGVKSTKQEIYLEMHTPSTYIPNMLFRLGDIQALEEGQWYKVKPSLIISVPNGKYAATASLELPSYEKSGILHILLEYIGNDSYVVETYMELSPLKTFKLQMDKPGRLEFKLATPFEFLSQIKFTAEGEINSKRSGKLQISSGFNSLEGKFDGSFDNTNGNMQAVTRLLTNIPGYENSAFAFAIQTFNGIGDGKSFHVEFIKPDWVRQVRLDADYRYRFESFTELEGEINVNMDSYMNVPPLHSHIKSGMKDGRYSGVIEGKFGGHSPTLKVETERNEERMTVLIEGKAGQGDRYNLLNTFEMIPLQKEFSIREKFHWNGDEILNTEAVLSDDDELFECHLSMSTPWGPVNSKAVLSPITFLTMNDDLSFSQLIKNSNVSVDVIFNEKKLVGLEIVSRDGMRLFEVHNPIRPVSLSIAVEKVNWNALRMKAGVCWNLKVPEKSSIGLDAYMYRRSTGFTVGGYLASANYGIITGNFEHFLISSKIAQDLVIKWNGFAGKSGSLGYVLNVTDKSTGLQRQVEYGLELVGPSRTVLISGGCSGAEDKYSMHNLAISWDAFRNPEKKVRFNFTSQNSSTWRTMSISKSFQVQHFTWTEPLTISVKKLLVHDKLKQIDLEVKPFSNLSSHLTTSAHWENGDWSSFVGSIVEPSSNINLDLQYNVTDLSKSLQMKYMLFTGNSKLFKATSEKTTSLQDVLVQFGDLENLQTICALNALSTQNEHTLKANLFNYQVLSKIKKSLPYMELTLRQDNSNKGQLQLGLPHPKEILLKATRSQFAKTVTDINFLVRLNSSNLLSARFHWRPELMDELVQYDWLRGSKTFLNNVLPSLPELSNAVKVELEGHWNIFSSPVKRVLSALYQFSKDEVIQIYTELQAVREYIQQLYSNNAFYMKDIINGVYDGLLPIFEITENIYSHLKSACSKVCWFFANSTKFLSSVLNKYYGRLEFHVMKAWDNMETILANFWKNNSVWLQEASEELEELVDALIEAFEGRIEMLEKKLMAVGFIRKIIRLYQEYAAWLDEIPLDDYMTAIENFFQVKVWDKLVELVGPYLDVVREALDGDYLKQLLETPPIPYIRFVLRQTKHALVRVWDLIEVEGKMKDLVRHALKNLDGLMQRNFPSWEINWDLDSGIVEYDQTLSFVEWNDFTQYPHWNLYPQDAEEVNQYANFYYQVINYIEHMKPIFDMRIRDILPPFGGFAMMAGDHHYYTFDKKYFRFAGDCSYVLVADLLQNGFSFIVNYGTSRDGNIRKKSYTIALPSHNIEFDVSDFKVTIDNRKVELPMKVDTVYIRRQETRLDIYDIRGYQITCSLSPSVCTFSTSGWYYGKLGGLLGTFDNEPTNDFKTADGQLISDIPSFTYSWRVGKDRNQCRMKNFAKDDAEEPVDVDNICYDLLANRNSPLRPCFNTVDTTLFMEMCKFDVSRNINSASRPESACTSMSAYVTECQNNNVDIWMPPTCIRCRLEGGVALTTGENVTLQTNGIQRPPSSSDIVFLVEEQDCMDQLDILSAVAKLEQALRAEGISDNRYAYVGFGGQGIHLDPHLHTSSSSVWSHSTLFRVPEKINNTSVARKSDLYSAIHFVSTMTFRAGVSKNLIVISCGSEQCGNSVGYADTLTLLVENDFKLHMLTPKPLTFKGDKKQDESLKVFGFDANGAFTTHHARRGPLVADASMKRQLILPKDLCTPLAVETNGTRFTTDNPTKKMLDVWSRRVAQTSQPSECQRCECVPDKNGGSRFMCHQCVSPSLWKFLEEWKSFQSEEVDDVFALEMMESEPFLLPPN